MKSLALGDDWRLQLDAAGNLATLEGPARIAQDVASYERTFQDEPWYAQGEGVPYWLREMGTLPQNELVIARANARALEVPGVATAATTLSGLEARTLTGDIRITTDNGEVLSVIL